MTAYRPGSDVRRGPLQLVRMLRQAAANSALTRMHPTPIYGFVKSASTDALTLQLDSIAGRKASAFDFAGTGTSTAMDADPANYEIAASGLDLSGLSIGEPTKLIGFATPFGMARTPSAFRLHPPRLGLRSHPRWSVRLLSTTASMRFRTGS